MTGEEDARGFDPERLGAQTVSEPKAERFLRGATEVGLHLLLVLSPIFLGAAPDWAYLPFRLFILLLTGLTVLRFLANPMVRPVWTWVSLPAVLFFGYVLFSLVPLPGIVLKALSPEALAHYEDVARWRAEVEESLLTPLRGLVTGTVEGAKATSVPQTLSMDPWRTRQAFLSLLTPLLVFFVAANLGGSRRQTKRFLATIAGTAGLLSAYGLFQVFTERPYVLWSTNLHDGRVRSTFVNPNHFSLYLEIALPLTFALVGSFFLPHSTEEEEESGWRNLLDRFRRGWSPGFVFVTLLLGLSFLALLYTQSRMGAASFLLVSIVGIPFLVRKRRTLTLATIVLLFLGSLLVAMLWVGIDKPARRLLWFKTQRSWVWNDSWDLRRDFPLTGSGLGTFGMIFPRYQTFRSPLKSNHAHNDFLEVWTDSGVGLGLILLGIGAVGFEMFRLRRRRRDPFVLLFSGGAVIGLGSVLVHSLGDFGLRIPANAYLFGITAGSTLALLKRPKMALREMGREKGASRRWFHPVIAGVVCVLLLGLALDASRGLVASLRFRAAKREGLGIEKRRSLLQEVVRLRPKEGRYLLALISAEELQMRLDLARAPEEGLRSALRALELAGRAQILHPASGNLMFAEGLILGNLDKWMIKRNALFMSNSLASFVAKRNRERGGRVYDDLRESVSRLGWRALRRAITWEPRRLSFHYALGLYGAFRWKRLGTTARDQVKASIAEAASVAVCANKGSADWRKLKVLRMVARLLREKDLERTLRRVRCAR